MNLYYSLVLDAFVEGPGQPSKITTIEGQKRGTKSPLRVQFLDGDRADQKVCLVTGTTLIFGYKLADEYDGDWLAEIPAVDWTPPTPGDPDPFYTATLNLNTTELNTAFHTPDSDATNDLPSLDVMSVFAVKESGSDTPRQADRVDVTIANAGYTGAEGVATGAAASLDSRLTTLEADAVTFDPGTNALTQPTFGDFIDGNSPKLSALHNNASTTASFSNVTTAFAGIGLTPLNATQLTTGTIPNARFPSTLPALNGSALTNLTAANLTGALPAISGASLTSLTAANLTGALPAISGASLTSLNASNLGSGTVPDARLSANLAALSGNTSTTVNLSNVTLQVAVIKFGSKPNAFTSYSGNPNSHVTGNKGDLCTDYTNGALYQYTGTDGGNSSWVINNA